MRKSLIITFIFIIFLLISSTMSIGSSSTTYLYLDTLKIDDSNIEVLSNEITIDTTTSKIENIINLKNISNTEIELNLSFPLENEELDISIRDFIIKLNGVQVDYVKSNDGNYLVQTKISANSGKKINIEYFTENDLQNARFIKCNFDNLSGKKIGKLKVDIKIDDKNIPLVEKIYPGHFTFKDNTVSIEYYNYEVNTLTRNIIVKKETFNNLLYGRETYITDEERNIISTWYTTGNVKVKINYSLDNPIANNIIDYGKFKNGAKVTYELSEPLLYEMYRAVANKDSNDLKGKNICIDFVESEGDKELYVEKVISIHERENDEPEIVSDLVKQPERVILQTSGPFTAYAGKRGAKIIFVNQGIDGENLNATEQEKVSYINQINADMYIRIAIYDNVIKYKDVGDSFCRDRVGSGMVGYYDNSNFEIAKAFALSNDDELKSEEAYNNAYYFDYQAFYSNYEDYAKNYYNDYYKDCLIKLKNEDIANECEIPTVMQFIGNRVSKNGKYVVNYFGVAGFYDSMSRGLITTNTALQTPQAKKMLSANKQKNSNAKAKIENEITNLSIIDDEQTIQQDLKEEIEEIKRQEELKKIQENEIKAAQDKKIENEHIIVFSSIGLGIIFCLIIILIEQKRKIKEFDGNGRKENEKN